MRLLFAELWNWCQHKSLKVQFNHGMTAIVGPNGSGKSNFINAVHSIITGDFCRFDGVKTDNINQLSKPGEAAGGKVIIEHNGSIAEITRSLRPNSRRLVINDGDPITSDKEIVSKIEAWLGLPIKVVGQYIFVNQWELFSILQETPSERAKDLYRLFRIDKAEKCYEAVNKRLLNIELPCHKIDIDTVRSRVLSSRIKLRELQANMAQLGGKKVDIDTMPEHKIVKAWDRKQALSAEVEQLNKALASLNSYLEDSKEVVSELEAKTQAFQESKNALETMLPSIRKEERKWHVYNAMLDSQHKLIAQINEVTSDVRNEPAKPDGYIEKNDLPYVTSELDKLAELIRQSVTFIETFNTGIQQCPVCATPVTSLSDKLASYKEMLYEKLQPAHDRRKHQLTVTRQYDDALAQYNHWLQAHQQRLLSLNEQIKAVSNTPKPERPLAELRAVLHDYDRCIAQLDEARKELTKESSEMSKIEGQIYSAKATLAQRYNDLSEVEKVTEFQAEVARQLISQTYVQNTEIDRLVSEIGATKRLISDDECSLEEAISTSKRLEVINQWKEELNEMRLILGRDALPRMVAQSHLSEMEDRINSALYDLNVDFRVKSEEGLKFRAIFDDGRDVPAERLSGGEKVVFALAWRLAVNSEFASDIGLLCLDEPTAGLDTDRLASLRLALEGMRAMTSSRGLQCLIITHERSLMPLFDHVVEIRSPSVISQEPSQ